MNSPELRLDQWLWAARFFRSRTLARAAIDGGKVHCGRQRGKASRPVRIGDCLTIRQGPDEKTVRILGLDSQRRGASDAARLYEETETSRRQREAAAAERRAARAGFSAPAGKPGKHQRQALQRLHLQADD